MVLFTFSLGYISRSLECIIAEYNLSVIGLNTMYWYKTQKSPCGSFSGCLSPRLFQLHQKSYVTVYYTELSEWFLYGSLPGFHSFETDLDKFIKYDQLNIFHVSTYICKSIIVVALFYFPEPQMRSSDDHPSSL